MYVTPLLSVIHAERFHRRGVNKERREMKTVSVLALLALAGAAQATIIYDASNALITAQPVEGLYDGRDTGTIYESALGASAGGTTIVGDLSNNPAITEDYTSIAIDPRNGLLSHRFAGGVATANHVLFFAFYDAGGANIGSYGVRLPQAGNFVWTITPAAGTHLSEVTPSGFVQMIPDTGSNNPDLAPSTVTWRFATVAPTIGSTTGTIYRQTLNVPTPGALALLGLGGLVAGRRRR